MAHADVRLIGQISITVGSATASPSRISRAISFPGTSISSSKTITTTTIARSVVIPSPTITASTSITITNGIQLCSNPSSPGPTPNTTLVGATARYSSFLQTLARTTISTAGTYNRIYYTGPVLVKVAGVTFNDCRFDSYVYVGGISGETVYGANFNYCDIGPVGGGAGAGQDWALGAGGWNVYRSIVQGFGDGLRIAASPNTNTCTLVESFVTLWRTFDASTQECIQTTDSYQNTLTVQRSALFLGSQNPNSPAFSGGGKYVEVINRGIDQAGTTNNYSGATTITDNYLYSAGSSYHLALTSFGALTYLNPTAIITGNWFSNMTGSLYFETGGSVGSPRITWSGNTSWPSGSAVTY